MWPARRSFSLSLPDVRNGIRDDLTLIAAALVVVGSGSAVVKSIAADFAVGFRRVTMDGDGGGSLEGIEGCRQQQKEE